MSGIVVATVLFPGDLAGLAVFFQVRWGIEIPGWFAAFQGMREWIWTIIAVTVGLHSAWMMLSDPKWLYPGVYRSRWLFGAYAASVAFLTPMLPDSGQEWMDRQAIWRCVVVVVLARWCLMMTRRTV